MTALADARPPGLNIPFRPGNTLTVELTWPDGELTDRTFTSDLDGTALALSVNDDVMTIVASATITAAQTAGVPKTWKLVETTGGGTEEILIGSWVASNDPARAITSTALAVTVGDVSIDVTVASAQASIVALDGRLTTAESDVDTLQTTTTSLDTRLDTAETDIATLESGKAAAADLTAHTDASPVAASPVHGLLEHRWSSDGWTPFTAHVVTADGDQAFTTSVEAGYGRVTGTGADDGNQRVMYAHAGMEAADGEITVLFKGPSTFVSSPSINRPQMGVLLRYQEIDGFHTGLVVWYDIFVGNPRVLNIAGWRGNGGDTLGQADGDQYTAEISRDLRIVAAQRFTFGSWFNELTCIPPHMHGLAVGDTVTIDCDDDTFDVTGGEVLNVDREKATLQYEEPTTTSAVTNKVANGTAAHADEAKRYFPYVVKARLVGDEIAVKAWRGRYEAEPADWQSVVTVATDADFPDLPSGAGLFGVVVGHAHDDSYVDFGDITFRSLD